MLTDLKSKSGFSMDAANYLMSGCHYIAVPHSAYYSCFQLMTFVWMKHKGLTLTDLKENADISKIGTHKYLTNELFELLKSKNKKDSVKFNSLLQELKNIRTDADYKERQIDIEISHQSIRKATEINLILKSLC